MLGTKPRFVRCVNFFAFPEKKLRSISGNCFEGWVWKIVKVCISKMTSEQDFSRATEQGKGCLSNVYSKILNENYALAKCSGAQEGL